MPQIDIRTVVASKAPKAAKYIPGFAYRYLERMLHQEEINEILRDGWDLKPQPFIQMIFKRWNISYTLEGLENLDPNGRYIFAANHPFGGMDGMMIAEKLMDHFSDARVVVNDILMNLDPLAPIWVPVNTLGAQNPDYVRRFEEAFAGNLPILTFPAGVCSRIVDGEVADLPWKNTFIRRAHTSNRSVVPLYVEGALHKWFYRLYRFRKFFGIKINIEMFLLVDGMFRQHGKTFRMIVGKPISINELKQAGSVKDQVELVRRNTYFLQNKIK